MSKLFDDASLAMIPSAYKDGKLYSIRPTDGSGDFTFSRGSNLAATRVDVNGLIEKGRENVLLNSVWDGVGANVAPTNFAITSFGSGTFDAGAQENSIRFTAPTSADRIMLKQSPSITGVVTASVFVEQIHSGSIIVADVIARAGGSSSVIAFMEDGVLVNSTDIVSAGKTYSLAISVTSAVQWRFGIGTSGPTTGDITLSKPQVEAGLVATDYIETGASTAQAGILEDMPRLDYSGSCPALLLEPQRSNFFIQSEYFGGSEWTKLNASVVDNDAVSPDGLQNACKVTTTSGGGASNINEVVYKSANTTYAFSIFVKAGNVNRVVIGQQMTGVYSNNIYDLSTNTWVVTGTGSPTLDAEDYGNGWYRLSCTMNSGASAANYQCWVGPINSNGTSFVNTTTGNYIYTYGATFEQGSYPTSYIPTYGSSVTRSPDITSLGNMQSNGITDSGAYSVFFDLSQEAEGASDADNSQILNFNGISSVGTIISVRKYYNTNEGTLRFYSNIDVQTIAYLTTSNKKCCMVVNDKEVKLYSDGGLRYTANLPSSQNGLDYMTIYGGTSNRTSTSFSSVSLFPTALTDSEAIALTL